MKTIKHLLAVLFIALTLQIADTATTQAKPVEQFQSIVVRTGPPQRRFHRRVYRRPVMVRRSWHHRRVWHRRPYRRY